MLLRNPLPIPDRGHRSYSLASEAARLTVLKVLRDTGGMKERFTFRAGPTHQTLMWDGYTVLNFIDSSETLIATLPGNAISLPVVNPEISATMSVGMLRAAGYTGNIVRIVSADIPTNSLVVVESDAFLGWVLVFRKHIFKMPRVEMRKYS
jgi:hypothetical protein